MKVNDSITKFQAKKLAQKAGSKTGKLKKKHIRRLKNEIRKTVIDMEVKSPKLFSYGELLKLGLFDE